MNVMTNSIRVIAQAALLVAFIFTFTVSALAATPTGGQKTDATVHPTTPTQTVPAALRPVFYRTLARDAGTAYQINDRGCAALPKQRLKACFDSNGAHFTGASTPVSLHLAAYGRGNNLTPVTSVRPDIHANRVNYSHGALSEWWRVLPMGFEQGFTVAKRPSGDGELMLALAANNQAEQHDDTLTWGRLRYGQLVVTDAKDHVIPAKIKSEGDRILIAVNDTHAAYPLTVDPLVWLAQEVTARDSVAGDFFGFAVAVSGTTALVGAYGATVNGNEQQGAVYVFNESNGVWSETQKLTASDGAAFDIFGSELALDGTTALIGAYGANASRGAAYVFTESDGTWTQAARLAASDGVAGDCFGWALALSGDTAFISAPFPLIMRGGGIIGQGAVYVFTDSDGTWSQTQKLVSGQFVNGDFFGDAVATDGPTLLVGADAYNSNEGAVYVLTDSGGNWSQVAMLTPVDGAAGDNSNFGYAVAVDGTTAFVGAPWATVKGTYGLGATYVFTNAGGSWSQAQKLTTDDTTQFNGFGWSIALEDNIALIGKTSFYDPEPGAAYLYTESNGTWTQTREFVSPDGVAENFYGWWVTFSGTSAFVGEPFANNAQGVVYFYGESNLGLAVSAPETVGQGENYVSQTIAINNASAASPAVSTTITVPEAASFVSATATQGNCSEASGVVTCDFGPIAGDAGTATANVTLKATGNVGDTIDNTASVAKATPPLGASAPTTITAGGACPDRYTEYDGSLNAGQRTHSPIYSAPAGQENAILTGPAGFQLYAVFQNAQGRKIFRIPGNEVHRQAPAGTYAWVVKASDTGGAYTLCVLHP